MAMKMRMSRVRMRLGKNEGKSEDEWMREGRERFDVWMNEWVREGKE